MCGEKLGGESGGVEEPRLRVINGGERLIWMPWGKCVELLIVGLPAILE